MSRAMPSRRRASRRVMRCSGSTGCARRRRVPEGAIGGATGARDRSVARRSPRGVWAHPDAVRPGRQECRRCQPARAPHRAAVRHHPPLPGDPEAQRGTSSRRARRDAAGVRARSPFAELCRQHRHGAVLCSPLRGRGRPARSAVARSGVRPVRDSRAWPRLLERWTPAGERPASCLCQLLFMRRVPRTPSVAPTVDWVAMRSRPSNQNSRLASLAAVASSGMACADPRVARSGGCGTARRCAARRARRRRTELGAAASAAARPTAGTAAAMSHDQVLEHLEGVPAGYGGQHRAASQRIDADGAVQLAEADRPPPRDVPGGDQVATVPGQSALAMRKTSGAATAVQKARTQVL